MLLFPPLSTVMPLEIYSAFSNNNTAVVPGSSGWHDGKGWVAKSKCSSTPRLASPTDPMVQRINALVFSQWESGRGRRRKYL